MRVGWDDGFRAGVLLVLVALLVVSLAADLPPSPVVLGPGVTDTVPVPSPGVEWRGSPPFHAHEWERLEQAAAAGPLWVRTAPVSPGLLLDPPLRLRTGRVSSLGVRFPAPEGVGSDAILLVEDPAGGEEQVRLQVDGDGVARGSVVLRPRVPGWQRWRVRVAPGPDGVESAPRGGDGEWVEWHGHAFPPQPLRILVLSGPPTQEVRFALRALEEGGEGVEGWLHLGRDLWTGREGPLPDEADAYLDWDLVLLFPGTPLPEAVVSALLGAVEAGTGLLLVGGAGAETSILAGTGLAPGWGGPVRVRPDSMEWGLPALLSPLPSAGLQSELQVELTQLTGEGHPWLRMGPLGRGRVGAVGLAESWRWRMEEGMDGPHRDWWSAWTSWLSDGLGGLPLLEVEGRDARGGEPLRLRWIHDQPAPGGVPLFVRGGPPGGEASGERWLTPVPGEVGRGWHAARGAVIPAAGQGVLLEATLPAGATEAGEDPPDEAGMGSMRAPPVAVRAVEDGAAPQDPGVRLATLATSSSGGGLIHVSEGDPRPAPDRRRRLQGLIVPVFLLLAGAAGASWAIHRLGEVPLRDVAGG